MTMKKNIEQILLFTILSFFLTCCSEEEYQVPNGNTVLFNDCIKRSIGPNIVGQNIEFAYAMALGPQEGKLLSARVESSIPGSDKTYLEHRSFHTNSSGQDIPVEIGTPSHNEDNVTFVEFTKDTCAATLRYYYNIPEEARGEKVNFIFSAEASTGEKVEYKMGPYQIAKMDMQLDMKLEDGGNCFLSIEDMKAYNESEAKQNADKIDLVYLFRSLPNVKYNHALISPSNTSYRMDLSVPTELKNYTSFWKVYGLRDRHLARLQYGIYVDDIDFQKMDFSNAPDYGLDMKNESGAWVETANKKYRAYIYINKVDNANKSMTISIKRYKME